MERMRAPGWKWNSGFFSMGSTATEATFPYVAAKSVPPRFSRIPQIPVFPSAIRHRWGHSPHRTASPSGTQCAATLSVADLEAMEPLLRRAPGDDAIDHGGPGRPGPHEIDHALHRGALSLEDRLHAAVGEIAHPSVDAGGRGGALRVSAEPDPLHAARDDDVRLGDLGHRLLLSRLRDRHTFPIKSSHSRSERIVRPNFRASFSFDPAPGPVTT